MPFTVPFDLGYEFEVHASFADVFDLLSNVPESAGHFPKLERIEKIAANTYRWQMERVGVGQSSIQTVYVSRYSTDRKKGVIRWSPVPGEGNAQVGGSWQVVDRKSSTQLTLRLKGDLTVPLPAIMEPVLSPVLTIEYEKLVETYIANLIERLGGEVEE